MTAFTGVRGWVRRHAWGLGLLIGLLIISNYAVRHFKRPGQMTVIESQAMDMTAMKPPVGSVPVATEIVSRGPFAARVRYTGSVVPYTEQNIYPRVEGWLTDLSVYDGDRVRAGQVLARLDAPDIRTRLSEAEYGHIAAAREVPVAQANLSRMRAERDAARGEVQSAGRGAEGAQARLAAAEKTVSQAQKELKSAQASLEYWRAEIKRESNLLKEGAVSQQEFDAEQAQYIAAQAEVENRRAKVEEAEANVLAARAEAGRAQAQLQVARDRARAAEAALSGAGDEVALKAASANMARAARATAAAFDRYREIKSPFAGVITRRFLSPGVLVRPGIAILNVAQIDRVRLQANVAEKDLASIRPGAEVIARVKGEGHPIRGSVSSISPSADYTSRTTLVEAIVDNKDHSLLPGEFVSMDIAVSSSRHALTVPSSAIIKRDGRSAVWIAQSTESGGDMVYYCTMHPEVVSDKPGICPKCRMDLEPRQAESGRTARLVYVKTGSSDGERTEILSGLSEGDEVIYRGHAYLKAGDAVTPVKWGEHGPTELPPPARESGGAGETGHENHSGHNMPGM